MVESSDNVSCITNHGVRAPDLTWSRIDIGRSRPGYFPGPKTEATAAATRCTDRTNFALPAERPMVGTHPRPTVTSVLKDDIGQFVMTSAYKLWIQTRHVDSSGEGSIAACPHSSPASCRTDTLAGLAGSVTSSAAGGRSSGRPRTAAARSRRSTMMRRLRPTFRTHRTLSCSQ